MNIPLIRTMIVLLSVLLLTTYTTTTTAEGFTTVNLALGIGYGLVFSLALIGIDFFLRRFDLRTLNTAIIGLFLGYLIGQAFMLIFDGVLDLSALAITSRTATLLKSALFLFTTYLGMAITARASEEFHMSIPFVKFKETRYQKRSLLIDASLLSDPRIIDLAASGLLDDHLIIPRFTTKELLSQLEIGDEAIKSKARRCLDVVKKLEGMQDLHLQYNETDFNDLEDTTAKLLRLARNTQANILTADINRVQESTNDGVRIINIHSLSRALKPLTQTGEFLNIKIQRYGKEARQGVGYLDDGTMVVINGGAEYIGETIKAQVLSVKHTSSGRMIFCNAAEEGDELEHNIGNTHEDYEAKPKDYFAYRQ